MAIQDGVSKLQGRRARWGRTWQHLRELRSWQARARQLFMLGSRFFPPLHSLGERIGAGIDGPYWTRGYRFEMRRRSADRFTLHPSHEVEREYYVNDHGRQMLLLGQSVLARYRELCGRPATFPEDGYPGEYVRDVAARLRVQVGDALLDLAEDEAVGRCREFAGEALLAEIREDLARFNVRFDRFTSLIASLPSWASLYLYGALVLLFLREARPRSWQTRLFTPPR